MLAMKVLGPGCANCARLEQNTRQALSELGLAATFEKVTDYPEIMRFGILKTPGLVVNEKVVVSGRVPAVDEVKGLLQSL